MARRLDGTTLGGFVCDRVGCEANGAWAPVLCVPYEGYPTEVMKPLVGMVDTHLCLDHWKDVRMEDVISKPMKDVIEETAALYHVRPDFSRAYLDFIPTASDGYLTFQQRSGLIPHDDAVIKKAMN